jgi:hypothetical protein
VNIDDLNDHPDLRDLRLSKKDEREARAEGRRRKRQAASRPSFLRRHRTAVVSVIVLAVLVVAAAALVDRTRPDVTETVPPSSPPPPPTNPAVEVSQPVTGTPAAGWADGATGIVSPRATPVGTHTAEQVATAYRSGGH